MAQTISASVGRGGFNREEDTRTVQKLLNRVPPSSGGPVPLLEVDGLCGPKTTNAIQTFQLLGKDIELLGHQQDASGDDPVEVLGERALIERQVAQ